MDLEKKFKKETGFDAYADNNLRPKVPSNYYVEWLEEQLTLTDVRRSSLSREEILKIATDLTNRVPDKIHKSDINDMEHIKANLKAGIILQLRKMNYD